jgi:hypothetical protein
MSISGLGHENHPSPDENMKRSPGGRITGTGKGAAKSGGSPFKSLYDPTPKPGGERPAGGGKSPEGSSSRVPNVR